jgi:sugar lactone lactonase YvrE
VLPVAVAATADGRVAVADLGCRCVHLYLPEARRYVRLTGAANRPLESPVAVAFDDRSSLFVSDSIGRVVVFGPDGAWVRELERAGEARMQRPTGLAFSPATGLLFVVDTAASQVHAFRRDGGFAFSFGRRGAEPGSLNYPTHIFRSAAGELYVADSLNFRIAIFDERGDWIGSFGHHGDGTGDLAMPKGLAVDQDGVVYVVDAVFDNVQLFDRQGTFLLTVGSRGGQPGEFWLPSGAFLGEHGELLVCDTYNRRIQVFRIAENYVGHTD